MRVFDVVEARSAEFIGTKGCCSVLAAVLIVCSELYTKDLSELRFTCDRFSSASFSRDMDNLELVKFCDSPSATEHGASIAKPAPNSHPSKPLPPQFLFGWR